MHDPSLLRVQVYKKILDGLRSGAIVPGGVISLNRLAQEYSISKTPLRDALLELQVEGFVTLYPQRGVMVRTLEEKEIQDIYETCGVLDARVILNVFDRIEEPHIQKMEAVNARINPEYESLSCDEYNELNFEFHNIYLQLEDNEMIRKILETSRVKLFQFSQRDWGPGYSRDNYREHLIILDMIKAGKKLELSQYLDQVHWKMGWKQT